MTSVIVPVFNGGGTLLQTVPSVLALDGVDEWVWVDDGSTDDTSLRLSELIPQDVSARVVRLGENRGRGAARNAGVAASQGETVIFFDADVEPLPEAAVRLVEALARDGALAAVASMTSVLDHPDDAYQRYLASYPRGPRGSSDSIAWRFFLSGACALRRSTLAHLGGFDENIAYGEDFDLACRLSQQAPSGLRLANTVVRVHDVATLTSALAKMESFGASLTRMIERCPEAVRMAGVPPSLLRLSRLGLVPPPGIVQRVVRTLPRVAQPIGVRAALGLSLLYGFGPS